MSQDNYGYDYEPPSQSGDYLRLAKKGQSIRVRLASAPYIFDDEVPQQDGTTKTTKRAAWIVIHKELGEDGKAVKSVKHFKGGMMVYSAIVDLVKDPEWGNPTTYDIEITRTEEAGKYYTVRPKPNGKPLTAEEKEMVETAGFDLAVLYCKKNGGKGNGGSAADIDPFADDD